MNECAVEAKPTISTRIWRAMGFRYHLGDEPDVPPEFKGWMATDVRMHFGFADRLRLLLSGKFYAHLAQDTKVECGESRNRLDWQIKPPGEGWGG